MYCLTITTNQPCNLLHYKTKKFRVGTIYQNHGTCNNKRARTFLHDSFRLEYVENTGAAMSMGDNLDPRVSFWFLGILPLTILMTVFIYVIIHARDIRPGKLIAISLIFAGGMGNILDRLLFDRHVTDFMNIGLLYLRSGIFNFADVWITTGVICFFLQWTRK